MVVRRMLGQKKGARGGLQRRGEAASVRAPWHVLRQDRHVEDRGRHLVWGAWGFLLAWARCWRAQCREGKLIT